MPEPRDLSEFQERRARAVEKLAAATLTPRVYLVYTEADMRAWVDASVDRWAAMLDDATVEDFDY